MPAGPLRLGSMTPDNDTEFWTNYRDWEKKVRDIYRDTVVDEHYDTVTRHSINLQQILGALPQRTTERLMREYETKVLDLPSIVAGSPHLANRTGTQRGVTDRAIFHSSDLIGGKANPRAILAGN